MKEKNKRKTKRKNCRQDRGECGGSQQERVKGRIQVLSKVKW